MDGAYKLESKKGAWGFIIRDHEGFTVLAGAGSLGSVHDALLAETMACKQALEAAVHFGISQVTIETDSSQLKEAITSSSSDLAIGGGLFREIRELLQDSFNCLNVCKIPRSCNSCAHVIRVLTTLLVWVWVGTRVSFIFGLIPRWTARDLAEYQSVYRRP